MTKTNHEEGPSALTARATPFKNFGIQAINASQYNAMLSFINLRHEMSDPIVERRDKVIISAKPSLCPPKSFQVMQARFANSHSITRYVAYIHQRLEFATLGDSIIKPFHGKCLTGTSLSIAKNGRVQPNDTKSTWLTRIFVSCSTNIGCNIGRSSSVYPKHTQTTTRQTHPSNA